MDDAARAQERVGDQIAGRYRLTRLLGAGGMGAVYEATHEFTQRKVAVKLMHPSFARSGQAAERFVREAQAPSSIGHPGIVEVLDGGRADDGSLYLVLELLGGETLSARMQKKPLPPSVLCPIALELLDALQAAHAAGFVHRDIKPENVFLVPNGDGSPRVKLLDFGIASVLNLADGPGLTKAGAVLGTPLYMSPEQALGRRVDARSDVWSVGAVCYQALTGKPPFGGGSVQALIVSISTEEHLPLSVASPELPLRLVKVIERALDKQVETRWQSAAEMADALRQVQGPRPAREERAPSTGRLSPAHPLPPIVAEAVRTRRQVNISAAPSRAPVWIALALIASAGLAFAALRRDPAQAATAQATLAPPAAAPASPQPPAATPEPAPAPTPPPAPTPAAPPPSSVPLPVPLPEAAPAPAPAQTPSPTPLPPTLDPSALSSILHTHDRDLQRCYEDVVVAALMQQTGTPAADPAPVRLDVELEIQPAGDVRNLQLRGEAPEPMRKCIATAIDSWRFPRTQAMTPVRFPIVFQPNIVR